MWRWQCHWPFKTGYYWSVKRPLLLHCAEKCLVAGMVVLLAFQEEGAIGLWLILLHSEEEDFIMEMAMALPFEEGLLLSCRETSTVALSRTGCCGGHIIVSL